MNDHSPPRTAADSIRDFVYQRYVIPARNQGLYEIEVRAGDVHRDMRLQSRMPAVCSALGTKFERNCGVRLIDRRGPPQGANVFFRFRIAAGEPVEHRYSRNGHVTARGEQQNEDCGTAHRAPSSTSATTDTVFLVSCVSAKRPSPAPAKDLYVSDWFVKARRYVERNGAPWFILSAKYGLVAPDELIGPYEQTLNTMPIQERRAWARRVVSQLSARMPLLRHIVFLAGARYREFLAEQLRQQGITVESPMEGLRIGEQLSWLGAR